MTDHIDPPHGEDPATQKWLDGRVMEAHHLSDEDRAAVTGLPAGAAMLVGIGGQTAGARYVLRGEALTVGRSEDADVFLPASSVSRRHAWLTRHGHGFVVQDEGSLNGTTVDGESVESAPLRDGCEVQFGTCRFLYVEAHS